MHKNRTSLMKVHTFSLLEGAHTKVFVRLTDSTLTSICTLFARQVHSAGSLGLQQIKSAARKRVQTSAT